jgi:predicted LPLAT superfamily acyltransferase
LHCEPFENLIDLPRGAREEALHACVARYAARLEHHCRLAPYNWFNFYDFWSSP